METKKGRISTGTIKASILGLIFLTVLLSMLPNLINTSQTAINSTAVELSNTALYGTGPAGVADDITDYSGWFWVVGVLLLVLTAIFAVFRVK